MMDKKKDFSPVVSRRDSTKTTDIIKFKTLSGPGIILAQGANVTRKTISVVSPDPIPRRDGMKYFGPEASGKVSPLMYAVNASSGHPYFTTTFSIIKEEK